MLRCHRIRSESGVRLHGWCCPAARAGLALHDISRGPSWTQEDLVQCGKARRTRLLLHACLSACLTACLSVLFVCFVRLHVCQFARGGKKQPLCLPACMSACLMSVHMSYRCICACLHVCCTSACMHLDVCTSICLFVCLFVCLCVFVVVIIFRCFLV